MATVIHQKVNNIPSWTQADMDKAQARYFAAYGENLFPPGSTINDITLSQDWNTDHVISGVVESVTGLNTDNTDPANPIVKISVDGSTITGDGTPGNPLVAATGGGGTIGGSTGSTDNRIIRADGTGGSTIQSSAATLDDSGNFTGGTFNGNTIGVGSTSGTNTGDQTSVSGNAGTATALQTARNIGGVSFNGTADIVPQTIQSVNEATDTTCFPLFINTAGSQSLQPKNNAGFIYNSNINALNCTTFIGALTGNATTATAWATGRTIAITGDLAYTSPSLDGSGNVTAAGTLATVNSNTGSFGSSTAIPSFTVNGKGLITAASTNAVIAPAGTLTGATLASGVTASSLTSLGSQAQDLNMNSHKVTNVTDPTSAQDAATKAYVDNAVTGLLDYRGGYDASTNLFPSTGGSGVLGAVLKGDFWICTVAGTLGGTSTTPGDLIIALVDTPGQTAANWDIIDHDISTAVTSVSGTTNRITSTGGQTPVIDISATFEALLGKVANPLSQFAATTSAQLRGVLSDETGTGLAYFQGGDIGTPSAGVATNLTGTATGLTAGNTVNISTATESTDTTCFPVFVTASGSQTLPAKTNTGLGYNSSTNAISATTFIGALNGNASTVTTNANLTGDITSVGNATAIASGVIVNADVNASAGILLSKTNISLTTTGTSGASTLNTTTGVLNIPSYSATSKLVSFLSSTSNTVTTSTGVIPLDSTIPQITEGTETMTISITPASASNILQIDAYQWLDSDAVNQMIGGLFQDSTANALAPGGINVNGTTSVGYMHIKYIMTAGTTSSTTFRFRGGSAGGTWYINQNASSNTLGGMRSYMTISEYTP